MNITVSYDASVNTAPAAFKTDVQAVVNYFESLFTDPISFNLHVGYGEVHGTTMDPGNLGQSYAFFDSYSYAAVKTALAGDSKTADDATAVATLPASDPDPSTHTWYMAEAEQKALGLLADSTTIDAYVGFCKPSNATFDYDRSNGITSGQFDFIGTVMHELTEVMGRNLAVNTNFINSQPTVTPLDLFHYSASGTRSFSLGGYFSFDNGTTNLDPFNTLNDGSDPGDWAPGAGNDSYLNESFPSHYNLLSETDLRLMDIIGWDRVVDEYGADTNFAGLMQVNTTAAGTIDNATDHDWIRVRLIAGTHYAISVSGIDTLGGTLADPAMSIYDSGSHLLIGRDDSTGSRDPLIKFTPKTTGFYYIDTYGVGGDTGSYQVTVGTPLTASFQAVTVQENTRSVTTVTDAAADGAGPLGYTIESGGDGALFQIDAATGALSFVAAPDFAHPADANHDNVYVLTVQATDGAFYLNDIGLTVTVTEAPHPLGTAGNDSFVAQAGPERIDGGGGIDTISFNFKFADATIRWSGNHVIVDGPDGSSHTVLSGFEVYQFTDGTITENAADPLVDNLFYDAQHHDLWSAGVDPATHYHTVGWREGLDPDPFFSTATYLSLNPAVKAAGLDPLAQFDQSGWNSGADPSIGFDIAAYLKANPDVAAAGVDPLAQFLHYGAQEGRQPVGPTVLLAANGFDYVYYLQHNPDVAAAHVNPLQHYETTGWREGRNPNAYFDDAGYLAHNADVAAAGTNPLDHYDQFGWREGRDPSVNFDTKAYLAAYPDVAAAGIDPLVHFLQHGMAEGRSSFADGVWS
jgi:hypothetical protein